MSKIKVVGLGMACLDIIIKTSQLPSWKGGVRLGEIAIEGGGPAATAIVATQRLGIPAGFIGTYGSDRLGDIKLQTISENCVDTSRMIRRADPENQVVLVAVQEETGERIFSSSSRISTELSINELDADFITGADFLHLDGYHVKAARQAARWMKEAGKKVMLDGSATSGQISPEMRVLVGEVDILISGKGFGQALTGEGDPSISGRQMRALGPDIVVQTEGAGGSYTVCAEGEFHTPAFAVEVVDTTGAGDVFHGSFLVGLIHNWEIHNVVLFSTAVAAIKCTQISGRRGIPTFDQAIQFLNARGFPIR